MHPLDQIITCKAHRRGSIYYVVCSDGRKAFIPHDKLTQLVSRLGDAIEVIE